MLTGIVGPNSLCQSHSKDKIRKTQLNDMSSEAGLQNQGQRQHSELSKNQVLTNEVNLSSQQRKKLRKKENQRKKKQQEKQFLDNAEISLVNIIRLLWKQKILFKDCRQIIEKLMNILECANFDTISKIYDLIRQWVKQLQLSFTKFRKQKEKEFPQFLTNHLYYTALVNKIYTIHLVIHGACTQIQKVINNFYKLQHKQGDIKKKVQYLPEDTLILFIYSDITVKALVISSQKKIEPASQKIRQEMQIILDIIEQYETYIDSTSSTDEEEQSLLSNTKKNKKIRENNTKSKIIKQNEDIIIKSLKKMIICEQKRVDCRVSEEWTSQIRLKSNQYRSKNYKALVQKQREAIIGQ